jgi:hypothetical protein
VDSVKTNLTVPRRVRHERLEVADQLAELVLLDMFAGVSRSSSLSMNSSGAASTMFSAQPA